MGENKFTIMADKHTKPSNAQQIRNQSPSASYRSQSVFGTSPSRNASIARLGSPVPASSPPVRQIPLPKNSEGSDNSEPLAGVPASQASLPGPGTSSLSQALKNSGSRSFHTPGARRESNATSAFETTSLRKENQSIYGSFDTRSFQVEGGRSPSKHEDIEAVRRHLIGPSHKASNASLSIANGNSGPSRGNRGASPAPGVDDDEFSSLQLQGGDITRHIYRYTEEQERQQADEENRREGRLKRSLSVNLPRTDVEDQDSQNLKKPGGLRRDYIRRNVASPAPSDRNPIPGGMENGVNGTTSPRKQPQFVTNNFIEFLTLYGHFAGEELDEDDEVLGPDEYFSSADYERTTDDDREQDEQSALLPETPGKIRRRRKEKKAGKGSAGGAALLLLKSFVGTGVLFLPRAFLNGGMAFSNLVLLAISGLSFWCFLLLVRTRLKVHASFGDMGGQIYGPWFRNLINFSLVVSQVGFASAYIVFVAENLQAFVLAVSNCRASIRIEWLILMQIIIFLPISLYRNINNIQKLALIADLFIALGLVYLYFYDIKTLVVNHGVSDIVQFNSKDWTLFIGTAIFTFEGIGLIIPIQSGMKDPKQFPRVLGIIMIVITVVFVSAGAVSYAAFGSSTRTVILLNLPQDDKMVNAVQLIYSLAILFSTPLQIYPAIEITSQQLFSRTGKYNPWIKWKKNIFRFFMVLLCGAIAWAGAGDLDKFVALVGSFACIPLVYIYPVSICTASHVCTISADPSVASYALPSRQHEDLAESRRHRVGHSRLRRYGLHHFVDHHQLDTRCSSLQSWVLR